jgi:type VI secretion system secreted protein Hcp
MSFRHYASFKGKTQGTLKGESTKSDRRDKWTELIAFEMGSETPVDANTGRPKGHRTHQPITITKENGAASPQLLDAHWKDEVFDEIVIEIVGKPSAGAGETVVQRVTLTNAVISRFRRYFSNSDGKPRFLHAFVFDYGDIDFSIH